MKNTPDSDLKLLKNKSGSNAHFELDIINYNDITKMFSIIIDMYYQEYNKYLINSMKNKYNDKKPVIYFNSKKDKRINLTFNTLHKITEEIPKKNR